MSKLENILILELFLCEQNDFFIDQQLKTNALIQQAVVGNRRKQK